MIKEFREFLLRGNVLDLAVAVVIGAAFTGIVNSLVNDIIMPVIGVIIGGIDFSSLSVAVGSSVISYGNFLQAVINFLLIGWVLFMIIKSVNSLERSQSKKEAAKPVEPPPTPEDIALLREIRDLLQQR